MEERETKIVKVDLIYTESLLISWGIGKLVLNVYTTMVIRYLIRHKHSTATVLQRNL